MRLPAGLKGTIAQLLLPGVDPILCASTGRVGSTMTRMALAHARRGFGFGPLRTIPRPFLLEPVWNLKDVRFRAGAIHFTHDFPYDLAAPPQLKTVFLYGRPSDTILSLIRRYKELGPEWMARHFAHMYADGPYSELVQRDVLRIGERLEAWPAARNANVLGLRYENLWDNVDKLSNFVGFEVKLPDRIERNFLDFDPALAAIVRENYRQLDLLEARLPAYFFTQPSLNRHSDPAPCPA